MSKSKSTTIIFIVVFAISIFYGDFSTTNVDYIAQMKMFFGGIFEIDIFKIPNYYEAILNTIAIATISIFISSILGFLFSLYFKYTFVRIFLAFIRSIHEIFWALLFLQIFGLNATTALLAITLPYTATLAKVYAEIFQEHGVFLKELEPKNSKLSTFIYTKLMGTIPHIYSYTLYRYECALKSTAVLGFIGISTIGYHLQSSFMQGYYGDVWLLLIMFYVIIASIKYWFKKQTILFLLVASFLYLDDFGNFNINNLIHFLTHDIIPYPIRQEQGVFQIYNWFKDILLNEVSIGIFNTIVLTQVSLIITALLSLIMFVFVSDKFASKPTSILSKAILIIFRSTPEYILAYLFLQIFGASMLPAVIAIALHNGSIIGHIIAKRSNEIQLRLDHTNKKTELYFYEIIPRLYGSFLAFLFYRWEVIMRESAMLGILGIYTLGFFIDSAISDIKMDKVVILLLFTALLNITIDYISRKIRKNLREDTKIQNL